MFRRIGLFMLVNLLVMVTITISVSVIAWLLKNFLGIDLMAWGSAAGLNLGALALFCLVWGMAGAFISLLMSKWMAKWMMGIQVVDPENPGAHADLVRMVRRLSEKAGLPKLPEIGVFESDDVNAFATGPSKSNSLVAVSTGLLARMDRDQVEGVVGHELAHIANGDMITMTLLQGIVNAFVMFISRILAWAVANFFRRNDEDNGIAQIVQFVATILFEIIFSVLGSIVVASYSRWREFRADAGGARIAGRSNMISALQRLKQIQEEPEPEETEERGAALATLKISGRPNRFLALFSTHPPLEARIEALRHSME